MSTTRAVPYTILLALLVTACAAFELSPEGKARVEYYNACMDRNLPGNARLVRAFGITDSIQQMCWETARKVIPLR